MSAKPTVIKYDNVEVFGNQPTPFLTISNDMIDAGRYGRWGQSSSITLEGQLTGQDYSTLLNNADSLVNGFSKSFKDLTVSEDGTDFTFSRCKVESINFSESKLTQLVDYTINLSRYSNFTGTFGVLDPQEKFSFSRQEDDTATLTHEISARGFATGTRDGLTNARNYVNSISGWNNQITPKFIQGSSLYSNAVFPVLISVTENIGRTDQTYGLTENYIIQEGADSKVPTSVYGSITSNETLEDVVDTVDIEVTCRGGKDFTMDQVRSHAFSLDMHDEAIKISEVKDLLITPVAKTVDEDEASNTITVKATYDNDALFIVDNDEHGLNNVSNAYLDSTVSMDSDEILDVITFSVSSQIIGRGNSAQQWTNKENFLANNVASVDSVQAGLTFSDDLTSALRREAEIAYSRVFGATAASNFPINKKPSSVSISKNEYANEITISATFDNKDTIGEGGSGSLADMGFGATADYTVDVTPSIRQLRPNASCTEDGHYIIYDLNAKNREKVAIQLNVATQGYNYTPFTSQSPHVSAPATADARSESVADVLSNRNLRITNAIAPVANAILEDLCAIWVNIGHIDTVLDSESQDYSQTTRGYSVSQTYSQDSYNHTMDDALQYIPVTTRGPF